MGLKGCLRGYRRLRRGSGEDDLDKIYLFYCHYVELTYTYDHKTSKKLFGVEKSLQTTPYK